MLSKRRRYLMACAGVMPAVAIAAGLLTLSPDSATRQQYWPWMPVALLVPGLAFSIYFWIFAYGRSAKRNGDERE
jgi:hypothetical protein